MMICSRASYENSNWWNVKIIRPYTVFIPSDIEDLRFMTTDNMAHWCSNSAARQKILISEPYEGFPAEQSGLRAGDEILEINGKSIKGKPLRSQRYS